MMQNRLVWEYCSGRREEQECSWYVVQLESKETVRGVRARFRGGNFYAQERSIKYLTCDKKIILKLFRHLATRISSSINSNNCIYNGQEEE